MNYNSDMQTSLKVILVGAFGAVLFFLLLRSFLYFQIYPSLSGFMAYGICFCIVYCLQRFWSFKGKANSRNTLIRYGLVQLFCAILSAFMTYFLVKFNMNPTLSSACVTITTSAVGFLGTRFWAFL